MILKKKILIAEDDERTRHMIKRTLELENENFEIFEARDGDEALAKAIEIKPNLLLLDVMMPGMSGYEVCKELKESQDTKNILILFVTARGGNEIAERTMLNKGGDGIIGKPFSPDVLAFRVREILKLSHGKSDLF